MSLRRKRSKAAVALASVALAGVLLVTTGTGSTSRSWTWEGGVPGEQTAGTDSPDRILVAEGDLALVAAPQGEAIAVGTSEGELMPLADLAGDEPLVFFAAAAPDGGPQRLVGVARSDVQQVEAVLRDGTTQELPLNQWRAFSYVALTPVESALGLVARSSDSEIGVVRVPQTTTTLAASAPAGIRAFQRPATARDRLPQRSLRWFREQGTRLRETREVARYRDGRGRLSRLFVARGVDAEGRSVTCQIHLQAYGMGSGCGPSRAFFAPGRLVAASSGRLMSGIVAEDVARVEIVGVHGRVHTVALTPDGGFIWNCHAYNGCACVVSELRAYNASGLLVTRQNWRSRGCTSRTTSGAPRRNVTPYRFSTQGGLVTLRLDTIRLFNGQAVETRLLAKEAGRAFYRLRQPPHVECFATGKASRVGEVGTMGCPGRPGGEPLVGFAVFSRKPGEKRRAEALEGFAADEVATIVAVDGYGNRLAEVTPRANVYVFRPAPPTAQKVIALDANGDPLPSRAAPRASPPALLRPPPMTRVSPSAIKAPIRTGSDRGVEISAGQNGVVVFRNDAAEPAIAAALHRGGGYGCFRLAAHLGDTESTLLLVRSYQPRVALRVRGLRAPFDGCEIQASYGHRWPDRFGSHSAVEVAFNERARRYFDDRATARDLALFVRSGEMQRLRRKTGSVLWSLLHTRYGDAVVFVPTASAKPPVGKIGVWVLGPRTIFSEQSPTEARLFVELRGGRIVSNNLRRLAMVF